MGAWTVVLLAALALAPGCATRGATPQGDRPFRFAADTFAFPNDTVWEYHVDRASGARWWSERVPRPPFSLRCGPTVRAVRQFFASARFDPSAPAVDEKAYTRLVRAVMDTDPRRPNGERIAIPGYPDLRSFSAAHPALLKANISGTWTSQLQRGNWRMIFPFSRGEQAATAARLRAGLARGWPAILHVTRFPRFLLNHMVLVYDVEETPAELRFLAYDPNDAEQPIVVSFDRATNRFSYPETIYYAGGPVHAYEVYDGLLY
jgi:uncharacterized protein YndB with AHSA1/START domain